MCHLSETIVATNDEVAYNETNIEATTADSGRIYYLKNSHGDIIGQMDEQGNLLASFAYNAFGELVSAVTFQPEQKEAANRFLYAGEQYDETSGLYYLRARHYDVSVGRFTQEDTYLGDGRNLYAYVHSNPLKYVDPTGHVSYDFQDNDGTFLDDRQERGMDGGGGVGNPVAIAGYGSTGRMAPNTLTEQMAMHQVQSNPLNGATKVPIEMNDVRWSVSDGWVKMQSVVVSSTGKTTIHFTYNENTGVFDDFKYK